MRKQEQIEEISNIITEVAFVQAHEENGDENLSDIVATALYNAGYREAGEVRKETAKEIFYRVVNICRKEIDFQDGTINTQLEPLYFGIINGCDFVMDEVKRLAKQYSVEVE